jgi:diacylglycerol kinase family enzyme
VLAVIFNRHHHLSDVILMDAHEVHVEAVPGLLAHMDGEALPALPASVRLADERVNILFPK